MVKMFVYMFILTERVQTIVRGFNNDWKRALEIINQEVMRAFTNFKNGTQILQVLFMPPPFIIGGGGGI